MPIPFVTRIPFAVPILLAAMFIPPLASVGPCNAFEPGWPMAIEHILSSNFCEWRGARLHSGIDFKTRQRTGIPVVALEDGWVSRIKIEKRGYGRALYMSHPSGHVTIFAHLDRFRPDIENLVASILHRKRAKWGVDLSPGKGEFPVKKGQVVAWSGETGAGPAHLHVEIRKGMNTALDPQDFGLRPSDSISPEILAFILEPLSGQTLLNGGFSAVEIPLEKQSPGIFKSGGKITATGPFMVKARVVERADGADNRMGVKQIGLLIDDRQIYGTRFDALSFSANHLGGLVYDLKSPGFSGGGLTYYFFSFPRTVFPNLVTGVGMKVAKGLSRDWLMSWNSNGNDGAVETWKYPWGIHSITAMATDSTGNTSTGTVEVIFNRPPVVRVLGVSAAPDGNRFVTRLAVMDPDVSCPPEPGRRAVATEEMVDLVEIHCLVGGKWRLLGAVPLNAVPLDVAVGPARTAIVSKKPAIVLNDADGEALPDQAKGIDARWVCGVLEVATALPTVKIRVRDSAGFYSAFVTSRYSAAESETPLPDSLLKCLEKAEISIERRGRFVHAVLTLPDFGAGQADLSAAVGRGLRVVAAPSAADLQASVSSSGMRWSIEKKQSSDSKKGIEKRVRVAFKDSGSFHFGESRGWIDAPALEIAIGRFEAVIPVPEGIKGKEIPFLFVFDGPWCVLLESAAGVELFFITSKEGGRAISGDGKFGLYVPPGAALGDTILSVSHSRGGRQKGLKAVGEAYGPEPWGIPFDKPVTISLPLPSEARGREAMAGIYSGFGSRWSFEGGAVSDGKISVTQRHLESGYMIFLDDSPPLIKGLKVRKIRKGTQYEILATVTDVGEGVDDNSFVLTVNGKRIDWDFDPDKDLLTAVIPGELISGPDREEPGQVIEIVLRVDDWANNRTVEKISVKL